MWLSKKTGSPEPPDSGVTIGRVTLAEKELAVWADGELRGLPVYSPAGICWRPKTGDEVLILKSGNEAVIAGTRSPIPSPGQLSLGSGAARLTLYDGGHALIECPGGSITLGGGAAAVSCGGATVTLSGGEAVLSCGGNYISVGSGGITLSCQPTIAE